MKFALIILVCVSIVSMYIATDSMMVTTGIVINEEDMKCIDYSKLNNNISKNSKFEYNVILSLQNNSEDNQNLCSKSINEFNPVYYCTINTDPIIHDILLKANYTFVCNKYLFYIYKKINY